MDDREQARYMWEYYGIAYPYDPVIIVEEGGCYVTKKDLDEAIDNALDSIYVERVDDDTITVHVGDRESGPIDDIYLQDVTRELTEDGDGDQVVFHRSNNADPLRIPVDVFEDPIIDLETF